VDFTFYHFICDIAPLKRKYFSIVMESCTFTTRLFLYLRLLLILIAVAVIESGASFSRTFGWIGKLQCNLEIFRSKTIPELDLQQTLQDFSGNDVAYSLVEQTEVWGIEQSYLASYLPRIKSTRCLTFLLMDPSPQEILRALEHSGFFVNKEALFIGYLTISSYRRMKQGTSDWPTKLFLSDVSLIFLVERYLYVFCYFCDDKLVPTASSLTQAGVSRRSLRTAIDAVNNDARGNPIYIEDEIWWIYRLEDSDKHCRPLDNRVVKLSKNRDLLTCFPIPHFVLRTILNKYNATFKASSEIQISKLWTPDSSFSSKFPMIIFPGPMARIGGPRRNYAKEVTLNRTTDKLIYCVDKRKITAGILSMLAALVSPFEKSVWICLISVTVLIVCIVRPENPVSLAAVLVGQGYLPKFSRNHNGDPRISAIQRKTRVGLVIFWSILMSTSMSYLYDASLTADMLVPLPDHVISTFEEMILAGYKIGYMHNWPLTNAWSWYAKKFNKPSIRNMNNKSFVPIVFDGTMAFRAVERAGELAIFKTEGELDETLEAMKIKLVNFSSIVCHVVKEPIIDELFDVSVILFHLSTEFVKTMEQILESGILKVFVEMRKWQKTYLQSLSRNHMYPEDTGFKATGFTLGSKIPVIFLMWSCGLVVSFFTLGFEIFQSNCMKAFHPQMRVRKFSK